MLARPISPRLPALAACQVRPLVRECLGTRDTLSQNKMGEFCFGAQIQTPAEYTTTMCIGVRQRYVLEGIADIPSFKPSDRA